MSHSSEDGIRPALVDRKFLSSNATSHEWMFGAIAELIDNACDPDVNSNQFWIDVEEINGETCLTFTDNGNGMNTEVLHHMLSFGFSDKQECNGRLPIGRYGNGFKSGSMRLGRDTLVFTCQESTMSVGMLSQTYLEKIDSKTVLVPIVTWDVQTRDIIYPPNKARTSLDDILKYSLFSNEKDLLKQIESIPCMRRKREGSKIIIYNLARDEKGNLELDFSSETDIRLSAVNETELENRSSKSVSQYRTSLKKYISILYMKPPMQVFLRKKKVKTICIKKILTHQKKFTYVPKGVTMIDAIKIFFGINEDQDEYGMMMYHRNRLIQAFRKSSFPKKIHENNGEVSYQNVREILETVIGVVELDCLTPNHIKQNFQDDLKFRTLENNLKQKLWQYCLTTIEEIEIKKKMGENQEEKDTWVQCDNPDCQKWRRLPFPTKQEDLPEKWFCEMNPDKTYNKCSDPEEPEEEPEIPRLPYGKKGRRSTNSISERSSPAHTSEAENTSVNGTITKFLIPLNKDSGHSGALESMRENLQEASSVNDAISSPTDDPDDIPQLTPQLKRIANECLQRESKSSGMTRRKRLFTKSNDVGERDSSNITSNINGDIEEIEIQKSEPELIVIDDDDDLDNFNNSKRLANEKSENQLCYKKLKSEPQSSPVGNQDENNFVVYNGIAVVKQEGRNNILATSDDVDTLEAPDMFNSFLQTSPTDLEMSNLNENPMQDMGTSPIPTQPVSSLMFVEELRNKYEQEIADLQWQKTQLQMELQSTVEELEHERERANALETRLKYYERDQINSQDSDVIILEEYS